MIQSYRLVDDGQASGVTELFTEDGRFAIVGAMEVEGRESLAKFFAAREQDTRRRTRHCLTNLSFSSSSSGEATIRATLMLFVLTDDRAATAPQALADVEDHYRFDGDSWQIQERTTTLVAGGA